MDSIISNNSGNKKELETKTNYFFVKIKYQSCSVIQISINKRDSLA